MGCRTWNGGFGEFCSSNPECSLFYPFSKILYSVSFFRVRLSVRLRFRVSVRVRKPFSPIVRELLLSLARLSVPVGTMLNDNNEF